MAGTLVVTNDFPPRIGGIESFVAQLCDLLDQDVVVYTSGPHGAAAGDRHRGYPVVRDGTLLLPTPATARRAAQLLRAHGAERVLFGAAAPLGWMAPALRRAGAERVVALTHGHEVWWASVPGGRAVMRRIGDDCDHLTTISAYAESRIRPALSGPARARILRMPPPVDLARFRPADHPAADDLLRCVAVGRFVVQKGFDTLVRAWQQVRRALTGLPAELVLVGDGPERERLRRLCVTLEVTDSVRFCGALPSEGVLAELQRGTVFALPMRTRLAGLNAEGLGLAALEAAACGLPVVVGDSGGAGETVQHGDTGYVVPSSDPGALARRLVELLADPAGAAAMGQRGRRYVARHFGSDQVRATLRSALGLGG